MNLAVTILLAIIGSSGVSSIIVAALQHRWDKKRTVDKRIDALMVAQRASMEERMRYLIGHYVEKGVISLPEKSNLKEMHRAYIGIGGDGNLDPEMHELDKILVKG